MIERTAGPGTPKPPLVAGREFCGTRVSNGERVMGYAQWGAFAEQTAASSALLWTVPTGWSAEEGAAFPVNYFTAYFAYWKAGLLVPPSERPAGVIIVGSDWHDQNAKVLAKLPPAEAAIGDHP